MALSFDGSTEFEGPDYNTDTGNGSALDSILGAVSSLGTTAIKTFGPQNSGIPVNQGIYHPKPLLNTAASGSLTTILVLVALIFVGVFAFKKLF